MTFRRAFAGYYGPTVTRRPIGARTWVLAAISAGYWLVAVLVEPFPPDLRVAAAAGLLITGLVMLFAFLLAWDSFGRATYLALAERESMGVGIRVVLWFAVWILYAVAVLGLALGAFFAVSALA